MHKYLYAILDLIANDLGPVVTFKADAAAVRMFTDVLNRPDTVPGAHPNDFQLVRLGYIDTEHQLIQDWSVIMTGEQWLATQQPSQPQLVQEA